MNPKKLFYSGLFFLGYLINCQLSSAQTTTPHLTTVIPPSPDVQAMQKYGDIPVGYYTGTPNISIPLYTIKSHDITLPITISYHASGIKVAEDASIVGLGWTLNAGGSISRRIVNVDDFLDGVYFNGLLNTSPDLTNFYQPIVPIINGAVLNSGYANAVDCTAALTNNPKADFEPDQFYYSLPGGQNGKFLLKRNGTAILEKQEKIDIVCDILSHGNIWHVYTTDGFVYDFTMVEYYIDGGEVTQHTTAVHLTKITSPTGHTMTFNYTQPTDITTPSSFQEIRNDGNLPIYGGSYIPQYLPTVRKEVAGKNYNSFNLASIDYDGGRVVFNYAPANTRTDVVGANQLNSIQVYSKDTQGNLSGTPIKTQTFAYSYFNGQNAGVPGSWFSGSNTGSGNPIWNYRLKLLSVTESGNYNGQAVTSNPYAFTYYEQVSLPSKDSFMRDHWGYFNGQYSNTSLIPNFTRIGSGDQNYFYGIPDQSRVANGYFGQAFTLTGIKYPEGGTTTFDYEGNDCDEYKSLVNDHSQNPYPFTILSGYGSPFSHGWPVGATDQVLLDMSDQVSIGGDLNGQLIVTFRANSAIPASQLAPDIAYLSIVDNSTMAETRIDPYYSSTYRTIDDGGIHITMPNPKSAGKYTVTMVINNTGYGTQLFGGVCSFSWSTQVTSFPNANVTHPTTFSPVGGLRISRMTDDDGINPPKVKKFLYHYTNNGNDFSYGRTMTRPQYGYWEESEDLQQIIYSDGHIQYNSYVPEHFMRSSDSNIPLNGSALGSAIGYDQVTVLEGENGENGKTVYRYHNEPDDVEPYQYITLNHHRPYNSTTRDPLNGSLIERTDYKFEGGQFVPIKDVVNNYTYFTDSTKNIYAFEDHMLPHYTVIYPAVGLPTITGPTYNPTTNDDRLMFTYSPIQSVWTYLSSVDEKVYSTIDATKYQETITNYTYSPKYYLPVSTSFTNSKGQVVTTNTTYPLDYAPTSTTDVIAKGIKNLLTAHVYTAPIEKSTTRTDITGANPATVAASLTVYDALTPQPSQLYQMESVSPISSFAHLASTGLSTSIDASYKPAIAFTYESGTGKLLVQAKNLDMNNGYLWGGQNKLYPIAECKNATNTEFYYQGYEDLATGVVAGNAHTGNKYATSPSVTWTRPNGRSYVISYWKRTGSGPWTYSGEIAYTGSSYTMTGGDSYDDVRIYPNDAQMSTYTYDPMTGITSVTDMKGLTTYFEYDGLQRLMNVKDKDGNIVKNYKYNLQH